MCCLFVNEVLQELNWFKQSYTSWFLGDYVAEGCTFIDFPFILLISVQFFFLVIFN